MPLNRFDVACRGLGFSGFRGLGFGFGLRILGFRGLGSLGA